MMRTANLNPPGFRCCLPEIEHLMNPIRQRQQPVGFVRLLCQLFLAWLVYWRHASIDGDCSTIPVQKLLGKDENISSVSPRSNARFILSRPDSLITSSVSWKLSRRA